MGDETPIATLAAQRLKVSPPTFLTVAIIRRAIDARRKSNIGFVYTLDVRGRRERDPGAVVDWETDRDVSVGL